MQYSVMRNGDGHEVMEGEEQALHLAFRAMGKDLDNITTEAIKAYMVLCRSGSLPDLALNLESSWLPWCWDHMLPCLGLLFGHVTHPIPSLECVLLQIFQI